MHTAPPVTAGHGYPEVGARVIGDDPALAERRARREAFLLTVVVLRLGVPRMLLTGGYAGLHARTDPGPRLRGRLDVLARRVVRLHWMSRWMPVLPAVLLLQARWDRPGADPAAVVVVAGYAALRSWHRRETPAAARWVTDPPGPPRAMSPTAWEEPSLGGRRLLTVAGLQTLAAVVVTLAAGT